MKNDLTSNYETIINYIKLTSIDVTSIDTPCNAIVPFYVYYSIFLEEFGQLDPVDFEFLNKYCFCVLNIDGQNQIKLNGLTILYKPSKIIKIILKVIDILNSIDCTVLNESEVIKKYGHLVGKRKVGTTVRIPDEKDYTIIKIVKDNRHDN